jgi:hypothetical protein
MMRVVFRTLPIILLFALILFVACTGCCLNQERWRIPNILHPGHIDEQRYNMSISDPLPATGAGMKNSGIRPRDADLPHDQFSVQSGIYVDIKPGLVQP